MFSHCEGKARPTLGTLVTFGPKRLPIETVCNLQSENFPSESY